MNGLSEALLPALLGLLNAFMIMGIIIGILYLYRRFAIERAGPHVEESMEEASKEVVIKPKEIVARSPPDEEVAAAVAAVKHHMRVTTLTKSAVTKAQPPASAWLANWLGEVMQYWDYNPYVTERRASQRS